MRQYMRERQESRSSSTVAHMMAPVRVSVGTATGRIIFKFSYKSLKLVLFVRYTTLIGVSIENWDSSESI